MVLRFTLFGLFLILIAIIALSYYHIQEGFEDVDVCKGITDATLLKDIPAACMKQYFLSLGCLTTGKLYASLNSYPKMDDMPIVSPVATFAELKSGVKEYMNKVNGPPAMDNLLLVELCKGPEFKNILLKEIQTQKDKKVTLPGTSSSAPATAPATSSSAPAPSAVSVSAISAPVAPEVTAAIPAAISTTLPDKIAPPVTGPVPIAAPSSAAIPPISPPVSAAVTTAFPAIQPRPTPRRSDIMPDIQKIVHDEVTKAYPENTIKMSQVHGMRYLKKMKARKQEEDCDDE